MIQQCFRLSGKLDASLTDLGAKPEDVSMLQVGVMMPSRSPTLTLRMSGRLYLECGLKQLSNEDEKKLRSLADDDLDTTIVDITIGNLVEAEPPKLEKCAFTFSSNP